MTYANRQRFIRINASTSRVQVELAHRDAHAVGAQIPKAQDALSISDNRDLHLLSSACLVGQVAI